MPKIDGFYKLYEKKLFPYLESEIKLLEIGVQDGSSIKAWRNMSPLWDVWGLDIDPHCKGEQIVIGSQEDKEILGRFKDFDIIIDDGGHTWKQQIETFEFLFPTINEGGLYVIEDLHTSFWDEFKDYHISTVDYIANLFKHLNHTVANNSRMGNKEPLKDLKITSIELYPSIVFIHK